MIELVIVLCETSGFCWSGTTTDEFALEFWKVCLASHKDLAAAESGAICFDHSTRQYSSSCGDWVRTVYADEMPRMDPAENGGLLAAGHDFVSMNTA